MKPILESGRSYEGSEVKLFHGFGQANNLSGIIESGAILSPDRKQHGDEDFVHKIYEDVIRHVGDEAMKSFPDVQEYIQQNKDDFLDQGQDFTRQLISDEEMLETFLSFKSHPDPLRNCLVWLSRDEADGRNYSIDRYASTPEERNNGGYLETNIPREALIMRREHSAHAGAIAQIPLDFVENAYLANASSEDVYRVQSAFEEEDYSIDVERFDL